MVVLNKKRIKKKREIDSLLSVLNTLTPHTHNENFHLIIGKKNKKNGRLKLLSLATSPLPHKKNKQTAT